MKFERKNVACALAHILGIGGAVVLLGAPAQAQDIKVDVTGSNIKRVEGEGSLPVQVITRESLEREGIQSAAQLLDRLAVNSTTGSFTISSAEGNTSSSISAASLRGLGAQRTLVLLNGRRAAVAAVNGPSGVDLNTIPLAAIERIEVLTDGASAVYGSDAIAGVINFILRKNYQGAEASVRYNGPQHVGGWTQQYSVTAGYGDLTTQKFNVLVTADYQNLGALRAIDRPFSRTAFLPGLIDRTSGNSIPGQIGTPVGTRNPGNPECLPPFSFPTTKSPFQCRFDFASVIDIVPPQEMWNVVGRGTWQITPNHQAFVEAAYADSKVTGRVSPSPISQATILSGDPISLPPTSPFYPHAFAQQFGIDGQPLNIAWRSLDLGPRTENDESKQGRLLVGMQGVAWGWDYNGALSYNENKFTAFLPSGWVKGAIIQPILSSGKIDFFHRLPPDQIALLQPAVIHEQIFAGKSKSTAADLHASKAIWQLPAGPLAIAVGGEFRKETFEQHASATANSGDVPGFGSSIANLDEVNRRIGAVFGELSIPIVKTLEGNVAVRYDHYSDFGSTTNPKASLRWQPVNELLVRGSYGKGFRAPTLPELYVPTSFSSTGSNHDDPLRCPITNSSFDCDTQFNALLGGNAALKPEKSKQYGVGALWEPMAGRSIGVDYWKVDVKDVVGQLGEDTIFNNLARSEAQGLVVRRAPDIPGLPGRIFYIIQTNQNIQKLKVDGLDVSADFRFPQLDWGQFKASLRGTYYIKWEQADTDTGELVNFAGRTTGGVATVQAGVGFPGSLPRWRHTASLYYDYGPWHGTVAQQFQNSYKDVDDSRTVGSYTLYDLGASYSGFKNWTLAAGIKNLLDTNPPTSAQGISFQVGYDPTYSDPRGRVYWGSLRYAFK